MCALPDSVKHFNREYFFNEFFDYGGSDYKAAGGSKLPWRLQQVFDLVEVKAGDKILDIGCGRGELLLNCAFKNAFAFGIDYSPDALHIINEAIACKPVDIRRRIKLQLADARHLPFKKEVFDIVFITDVLELLSLAESETLLKAVHFVLKPKGVLAIHTAPNKWYFRFGYPFYRLLRLINDGEVLPIKPRRSPYDYLYINEQNFFSFKYLLRRNNFTGRVSLTVPFTKQKNIFKRFVFYLIYKCYPLNLFFCPSLWCKVTKQH